MKKTNLIYILLGVLLFIIPSLKSQSNKNDSLKLVLQNHKNKDTTRVNLLNALAFSYLNNDLTKTIEYLDESMLISDSIGYTLGNTRSLFLRGDAEMQLSNMDKAFIHYNEALLLYEKIVYKVGVYECYAKMGMISYYKRDYNNAIKYLKKSVRVAESINHFQETALSIKFIGYAYDDLNNFDDALLHYKKALKINKKYDNKIEIASCLNNIGILYGALTNNRLLALEYYNESLMVSEIIKDSLGMLKVLNNIGTIYESNKNHDKAIEIYERSLVIQKNMENDSFRGMTLNNLGNLYQQQRKFEKALAYLNESLQKSQEKNDRYTESATLNIIGDVYLELEKRTLASQYFNESIAIKIDMKNEFGLIDSYTGLAHVLVAQKKYNEALIVTQKANVISDKFEVIGFKKNIYELFSEIYKNTGDYKKAFESHKQLKIFNDSLFNKKNIEKFAQLEAEYKYKRQLDSASIRELKLTKTVKTTSQELEKSQRNYLWAIIGFLLISIVLGTIIFAQKFKNITVENQNIVTEQRLLRSQMTPHFIFNSLSVLQGMILNKEDEKSVSYLSKFSKLLRVILENSRDKIVPLEQELIAVKNYLSLQNLEDNTYQFTISVEKNIDTSLFQIPPMLIQPFVENALEHAFGNTTHNKQIDVHLKYEAGNLICTITDNGIGIDSKKENTTTDKSSLATTITAERLKILSKDFKKQGAVLVEDRKLYNEQGTIVTLVIPYKKSTI